MSNIFRNTGVSYFQIPQHVVQTEAFWKLTPSSKSLYVLLLFTAQAKSKTVFRLRTKQIEAVTGLSESSTARARKELTTAKLVASKDAGIDGIEFEILDPINGQSLSAMPVDFNTLSEGELRGYFMHHLHGPDMIEDHEEGNAVLIVECPFHSTTKTRLARDRALYVRLADGGVWGCKGFEGCGRSGRLLDFEQAMAERSGAPITRTEAHHRVYDILLKAKQNRKRREEIEFAMARRTAGFMLPSDNDLLAGELASVTVNDDGGIRHT